MLQRKADFEALVVGVTLTDDLLIVNERQSEAGFGLNMVWLSGVLSRLQVSHSLHERFVADLRSRHDKMWKGKLSRSVSSHLAPPHVVSADTHVTHGCCVLV